MYAVNDNLLCLATIISVRREEHHSAQPSLLRLSCADGLEQRESRFVFEVSHCYAVLEKRSISMCGVTIKPHVSMAQ